MGITPQLWSSVSGHVEEYEVYLRSLYMELKNESRCSEAAKGIGQDPSRDQTGTDQSRDAHGASATNPLREVSDDSTTDAGSGLHQNTSNRCYAVILAFLGSQERGVAVLGGMGVEVEPLGKPVDQQKSLQLRRPGLSPLSYRHKYNAVYAHTPLFGEHHLHFVPEDACRDALMAFCFSIAELLRFGERNADQTHANRKTCRNPLRNASQPIASV